MLDCRGRCTSSGSSILNVQSYSITAVYAIVFYRLMAAARCLLPLLVLGLIVMDACYSRGCTRNFMRVVT